MSSLHLAFPIIFLLLLPRFTVSQLVLTVAADGSGNFTTIREAIDFVPGRGSSAIKIMVSAGVYAENLVVRAEKVNVTLIGAGRSRTIITGNRSSNDGWSTSTSATLAIEGRGFAASDLTVQNTAVPSNGQAVALRVDADQSAFHRCIIDGNQDTLYARSGRQFYRDCEIRGTVDFIFGDGAAVFQNCRISPRGKRGGTITAQGRSKQNELSAFAFDRCVIKPLSGDDVPSATFYLGRPWRPYARVVFMKSYMADVINPEGWVPWNGPGKPAPETVFYGEFENGGPGAAAAGRVKWKGVRQLNKTEALWFSVGGLLDGDSWIPTTGIPYDSQI
ncbi:putative pectinesterase/pectinesterase inhibitor 22 [Platanthera zijinensis]|uniref:Pectinesterase n=1 Tax=Platanthera zijinensis TaxID=2320716 RepID=A0AAP0G0K2_9ASPA